MPDPTLSPLLERVKNATGPDRETDVRLHAAIVRHEPISITDSGYLMMVDVAVGFRPPAWPDRFYTAGEPAASWPRYTASLDAAVALVERVLPATGKWWWQLHHEFGPLGSGQETLSMPLERG